MSENDDNSSILWETLPTDLYFKIFRFCDVSALQNFALASKALASVVLSYLQSDAGVSRMEADHFKDCCDSSMCVIARVRKVACSYGKLLRVVTLGFTARAKINAVYNILRKRQSDQFTRLCLTGFGYFAHIFTKGWSRESLLLAHNRLTEITHIDQIVDYVLNSAPGQLPTFEMCLRDHFQGIYTDPLQTEERCYWLGIILNPYPYVHQAKLLYIFFGPIGHDGYVDWQATQYEPMGALSSELWYLAVRLTSLIHCRNYSHSSLFALVTEITSLPELWHPINVAYFVIGCGDAILNDYLSTLLSAAHFEELAIFIIQCTAVCMKTNKPIKQLISVLMEVLQSPSLYLSDRKNFISYFPDFLNDVITYNFDGDEFCLSTTMLKKSIFTLRDSIVQTGANSVIAL